jgi:hypothetical protein
LRIAKKKSDRKEQQVRNGSLASDLTCQRHVRLDRDLGHSGGTGEQFRAGIQRSVDKGWMVRHESGTYVKFTPAGAELFAANG